jgi:hypothetical protein
VSSSPAALFGGTGVTCRRGSSVVAACHLRRHVLPAAGRMLRRCAAGCAPCNTAGAVWVRRACCAVLHLSGLQRGCVDRWTSVTKALAAFAASTEASGPAGDRNHATHKPLATAATHHRPLLHLAPQRPPHRRRPSSCVHNQLLPPIYRRLWHLRLPSHRPRRHRSRNLLLLLSLSPPCPPPAPARGPPPGLHPSHPSHPGHPGHLQNLQRRHSRTGRQSGQTQPIESPGVVLSATANSLKWLAVGTLRCQRLARLLLQLHAQCQGACVTAQSLAACMHVRGCSPGNTNSRGEPLSCTF